MTPEGKALVAQVLKAPVERIGFRESLAYMRQRHGSGRAAARAIGVSEGTLRRWAAGTNPKPDSQRKVIESARASRMRPTTMGDAGVLVKVIRSERRRTRGEDAVSGRQLQLQSGTLAAMKQTWITTGDSDQVLKIFLGGIGDEWYRRELTPREWRNTVIHVDDAEALESDYGMSIA